MCLRLVFVVFHSGTVFAAYARLFQPPNAASDRLLSSNRRSRSVGPKERPLLRNLRLCILDPLPLGFNTLPSLLIPPLIGIETRLLMTAKPSLHLHSDPPHLHRSVRMLLHGRLVLFRRLIMPLFSLFELFLEILDGRLRRIYLSGRFVVERGYLVRRFSAASLTRPAVSRHASHLASAGASEAFDIAGHAFFSITVKATTRLRK